MSNASIHFSDTTVAVKVLHIGGAVGAAQPNSGDHYIYENLLRKFPHTSYNNTELSMLLARGPSCRRMGHRSTALREKAFIRMCLLCTTSGNPYMTR